MQVRWNKIIFICCFYFQMQFFRLLSKRNCSTNAGLFNNLLLAFKVNFISLFYAGLVEDWLGLMSLMKWLLDSHFKSFQYLNNSLYFSELGNIMPRPFILETRTILWPRNVDHCIHIKSMLVYKKKSQWDSRVQIAQKETFSCEQTENRHSVSM